MARDQEIGEAPPIGNTVEVRSESDGVVTFRSGLLYWFSLFGGGAVAILLAVVLVIGPTSGGRPLVSIFLVFWVSAWWWVGIRPRVELHARHVLVFAPYRTVKLDYGELRPPEFSGSYAMTGPLLRLIGRFDRVTVWPGGGGRPPPWQVELEAELRKRIARPRSREGGAAPR